MAASLGKAAASRTRRSIKRSDDRFGLYMHYCVGA